MIQKIYSKYPRLQETFYAIVEKDNDKFILDMSRLPIFYLKGVAKKESKNWPNSKIIKVVIFKSYQ